METPLKIYAFSIPITATSGQFTFPKMDYLQNKKVKKVVVYHPDQVTHDLTGRSLVSDANFKRGFVTLKVLGKDDVFRLPFSQFNPPQNNGRLLDLVVPEIDMNNSYVEFGQGANVTVGDVVYMAFFYEDPC